MLNTMRYIYTSTGIFAKQNCVTMHVIDVHINIRVWFSVRIMIVMRFCVHPCAVASNVASRVMDTAVVYLM